MDKEAPTSDMSESDPQIRIKVNLDDLGLWDSQFPKRPNDLLLDAQALQKPAASPPQKCANLQLLSDPDELMNLITTRMGTCGRPRLVDTEDFRNSVIKVAQSIIVSRKSGHSEVREPECKSIGSSSPMQGKRPPLEMSPLIRAFQQALRENEQLVEETAEVPPIAIVPPPFTSTPILESCISPLQDTPLMSPSPKNDQLLEIHLQDAPAAKMHTNPIGMQTFLEASSEALPMAVRYHWTTQAFKDASAVPVIAPNVPPPLTLSSRDQLKQVRILEKVSSRKIWKAWKRYNAMRKPSAKDNFKEDLRGMVLAALDNSKLIREELHNIREHYSHLPTKTSAVYEVHNRHMETQVSRSASTDLKSYTPPMADSRLMHATCDEPLFKSVRVLIAPNVQSPIMMDKLLDDLTVGIGRASVRMCSAQQSLHPKAFIVVISSKSLTVEEWKSRVINCYYIYAWDQAFPIFQTLRYGLPWEVRVRNDMNVISPAWVLTGSHAVYNSSEG